MLKIKKNLSYLFIFFYFFSPSNLTADTSEIKEILQLIQKDLRTLERAVYSESFSQSSNSNSNNSVKESEDVLTRHLLKLSEIEKQFQQLTNRYEEINFKIDKLNSPTDATTDKEKILPGSTQPQDLGTVSYKDMTNESESQSIQSIDATKTVVTETFQSEEKILPDGTPENQYEFATSFLKVGDYNMAERAFREFVDTNPEHKLSGNAQYWYAETFRIRQLYTDAASAYLEGYQKYPKSEKAPINLLKLGVSLVQIGEKDQGCLMISGVKKQYPEATQSVLQKAKYEEKKFECKQNNS